MLTVPFIFILLWISIFGNSSIDLIRNGNAEFGERGHAPPEPASTAMLSQYPGVPVTAGVATFTGLLFYVT